MKKLFILLALILISVSSVSAANIGSSSWKIQGMPCTAASPYAEIASVVKASSSSTPTSVDFNTITFKVGDTVCLLVDTYLDEDWDGDGGGEPNPDNDGYGLKASLIAVVESQGYIVNLGTWHQYSLTSASSTGRIRYGVFKHASVGRSGGGGGGSVRKLLLLNYFYAFELNSK